MESKTGECDNKIISALCEDLDKSLNIEPKPEIDEFFILRLPPEAAEKLHKELKHTKRSGKLQKKLSLEMDEENKIGIVQMAKKQYKAEMVNLPTTIDVNKSVDGERIYKCGSICQMLVATECEGAAAGPSDVAKKENVKPEKWPHGITPPMKNARKRRFRKKKRKDENVRMSKEVQAEVAALLRSDLEAISTRYEIVHE